MLKHNFKSLNILVATFTIAFLRSSKLLIQFYEIAVVCFAGDALICVFRPSDDLSIDQNYALRALQCACELRKHHNQHLATHIAVTVGELKFAVLGGFNNEWSYILNGPCINQLSACIELAGPKQVVASGGEQIT